MFTKSGWESRGFNLDPRGAAGVAIDGRHVGRLVPKEGLSVDSLLCVEAGRQRAKFVKTGRRFFF